MDWESQLRILSAHSPQPWKPFTKQGIQWRPCLRDLWPSGTMTSVPHKRATSPWLPGDLEEIDPVGRVLSLLKLGEWRTLGNKQASSRWPRRGLAACWLLYCSLMGEKMALSSSWGMQECHPEDYSSKQTLPQGVTKSKRHTSKIVSQSKRGRPFRSHRTHVHLSQASGTDRWKID